MNHGNSVVTEQGLQMFIIRIIVFGLLAFYSYSMGMERGGLNAFGHLVVYSGVIFIPVFYMLPTIEAWLRKSENLPAIAAVNLLLGWTLIGWVVALAWALKRPSSVVLVGAHEARHEDLDRAPQHKPRKSCQFCGEEVLEVAVKCKHCGSDLGGVSISAAPKLRFGWVAIVICDSEQMRSYVSAAIIEAGFPVIEMNKVGGVAAGAFEKKSKAENAAEHLEVKLGFSTAVMFRDKISGDYS